MELSLCQDTGAGRRVVLGARWCWVLVEEVSVARW